MSVKKCVYLNEYFLHFIDKVNINTIFECGSRDCWDAIEMKKHFNPEVIYSFECNPESIPICRKAIEDVKGIKLIPKAVCDKNGIVDFYATDMELSIDKNIGASSLLKHKGGLDHPYQQKRISVGAIRLDFFMKKRNIKVIDLLCFDLQGAEYLAIEGLGERIKDVRFIISEISRKSFYHGDMLLPDFINLLESKNFDMVIRQGEDALFINKSITL